MYEGLTDHNVKLVVTYSSIALLVEEVVGGSL